MWKHFILAIEETFQSARCRDTDQWVSIWPMWRHLQVPSSQNGSAWEWYHWIGLEKEINCYRFLILYFSSWIFDKSSKFWAASCKNESNLLLVWIMVCMCSNRNLFRRSVLKKYRREINSSLDYSSWLPQSKPKKSSTLANFSSNNR
jgi:hypothetical protein